MSVSGKGMRSSMIHATLIQLDTVYWSTSVVFSMISWLLQDSFVHFYVLFYSDWISLVSCAVAKLLPVHFLLPPCIGAANQAMMKPQQFRSICWWLPDKWCDVASWHWRTMTNWKVKPVKLAEGTFSASPLLFHPHQSTMLLFLPSLYDFCLFPYDWHVSSNSIKLTETDPSLAAYLC